MEIIGYSGNHLYYDHFCLANRLAERQEIIYFTILGRMILYYTVSLSVEKL